MKDAGQKDLLYRHFRAQGWYAVVEVPVFYRGGYQASRRLITDADVLAFRPSPDLRWDLVLGDCSTKGKGSAPNRALWVRGLMDHFCAVRGVVVLNRSKAALEPDHLLFASARDVTVLDEAQFPAYDRAIVYPAGSSSFPEVVADLRMVREEVVHRFPRLAPVGTFLTTEAWNEPDLIVAMRKAIAAGRSVAREIDPSRREQVALTLEAAGVFAIGFAACVGRVFHQYLQPKERATLSDALKVIVWGGRDQYEYIASLRRAIIEAKGPATGDPPELSLPDWDVFLQLVRSHLDVPRFSFRIPQLLRSAAIDVAAGRPFLSRYGSASPMLIKLAMFVASYYAKASLLPPEIVTRIRDLFLRQMSDVASRQTAQRDAVTATQDDSGSGGTETPPPGSSTDWFS